MGWLLACGLPMPARYAQHYTATVMMPLVTVQICNIWLCGRGVIRPLTGVDERANGIWMDVAGAEHLFGDVRGLMLDCARRLRRSGLRPRFAAAPTCGAAWALAHYARPGIHIVNQPSSLGQTSLGQTS
jgi:hypothetical protein